MRKATCGKRPITFPRGPEARAPSVRLSSLSCGPAGRGRRSPPSTSRPGPSAPSRKYLGIRAPLQQRRLRCAPSLGGPSWFSRRVNKECPPPPQSRALPALCLDALGASSYLRDGTPDDAPLDDLLRGAVRGSGRNRASGRDFLEGPRSAGALGTVRRRSAVRAPKASWDMQNGQIFLPEGGSAENDTGWSSAISTANLSLPERILTATGKASLSGPGLSVVGDNLVWHWREGKVSLEMPKTRLEPSLAFRRRG